MVKSRFLKLNSSHIEYVLDRMRENTTYVRNIKKYLLAALYNAPATIPWHAMQDVMRKLLPRLNVRKPFAARRQWMTSSLSLIHISGPIIHQVAA